MLYIGFSSYCNLKQFQSSILLKKYLSVFVALDLRSDKKVDLKTSTSFNTINFVSFHLRLQLLTAVLINLYIDDFLIDWTPFLH